LVTPPGERGPFVLTSVDISWNLFDIRYTKSSEFPHCPCRITLIGDTTSLELVDHPVLRRFRKDGHARRYAPLNKISGLEHSLAICVDGDNDGIRGLQRVINDKNSSR
jgi:hypothetical protein